MHLRKGIPQSIRVGLYKTAVRPVVTYSGESWTVVNKMERSLMTWKRKILRKIYGSVSMGKYGSFSIGECMGQSV
jgi:hypothetical protein